jgi:hypothetical protein
MRAAQQTQYGSPSVRKSRQDNHNKGGSISQAKSVANLKFSGNSGDIHQMGVRSRENNGGYFVCAGAPGRNGIV